MRTINNLDEYLSLDPSQLVNTVFLCPECGREHKIPFQVVMSGQGLIGQIPEIITQITHHEVKKVGLVYDRHIEEKLESLALVPLHDVAPEIQRIPLGKKGYLLDADVRLGDETAAALVDDIDIFIAIGSGVICDLTKWIATKKDRPFILLGTAGSMNAYTSITASMTENNIKTSKWLTPANAVLLDSCLLASAPTEMTCSGIGDLLARNVCNADWKLSQLIRDTYFCPVPYRMMASYQEALLPEMKALGQNRVDSMPLLSDAILVSGYTMTILDGQTSPSSGSEHIISHFFDFQHKVFDLPKNFHGTQVGVGTIIMLAAYECLREVDPQTLDIDDIERRRLSQAALNLDHVRVFGDKGTVFNQVSSKKRISDVDFRAYIEKILADWEQIWTAVDPYLMPAAVVRHAMQTAGAVTTLAGVNRSVEDGLQALLYGSRYRSRYTILDLFWELGLFPIMAREILERSGVLG